MGLKTSINRNGDPTDKRSGSDSKLVVHVGNYDPDALDGVSTTVVGQCNALIKSGTPIEVWTFRCGLHEVETQQMPNGLRVHLLPRYRNPFLAAMALPAATRTWIAKHLPNVRLFHLHSVFSPQNNRVAALGVPYGVTPNGGWGPSVIHGRRSLMKRMWITLFEKSLWRNAAFVQAVSRNETTDLESLGVASTTVLIPNGTTIAPRIDPVEPSVRQWLFLGRLAVDQKGLDLLLQAYASAKKDGANLPRLVLAGPDFRDGLHSLKALAKKLAIETDVEFPGPVTGDSKTALWKASEAFVHTSRWEGLPLSILEALGQGIPCLVTPETGLADWMEANECGWRVNGDVPSIARTLSSLSAEPRLIKTKAANTKPAVTRDFSWEAIARKLLDAYSRDLPRKLID